MTVAELISINNMITDLLINEQKDGLLNHIYRIGSMARYYPGDEGYITSVRKNKEDMVTVIKEPINACDTGKEYFKILLKVIPPKILNSEVLYWRTGTSFYFKDSSNPQAHTSEAHGECVEVHIDWLGDKNRIEQKHTINSNSGQISMFDL